MRMRNDNRGFSLFESVFVIVFIGVSFLAFGYLFGSIDQEALKADLTVLATKLAREKLEEVIQVKADSGYSAVNSEGATSVTSGTWSFTRTVNVSYVNPLDFSDSVSNTGYKKIEVVVSWGDGGGEAVVLTSLVGDMVPSAVTGGGLPPCP